jgi:tetratricopeptide (TPR) repeat protein
MLDLRAVHRAVKREDWLEAWRLGNQALNLDPENPEALFLLGATMRASGNLGVALTLLAKSLATQQRQPNLWMTYAATLHDLNRWEEAEQAFRHVHKMLPQDPMPIANIGATYVQRGRWREAIEWCSKAIGIDPENHIARISHGFASLSLGRWKEAWQYAEALYGNHLQVRVYNDPEHEEPQWDGSPGKTVVVQCDQGVGDIIMFAQCLPRMQALCKTVIVECAERMAGMFRRCFPGTVVYGTLKQQTLSWPADHQIDASIHISYLGRFFLNRDEDFARNAYLTPDPEKLAKWLAWLEGRPKPWRGIAWKGGIQATQTHLRSVELPQMAPLMSGTVIDLSYHDSAREVALWNIDDPRQVIRPPIDVRDYDDTIALIAALDEVATVTTTVAHVCGALGRKAHVLVPAVAQWRYAYRCGDGMIWYPADSVQLHRQAPGETDWAPAINRMARAM